MMGWFERSSSRIGFVVVVYFLLQFASRVMISPSLDYDESEQMFLSQSLLLGYNSQPPLYTWVQTFFFETIGYNVAALAALKNLLLCGTFLFVYALVHKTTHSIALSVMAVLGLMTIPQISWESQRDLSHTVAVTFATVLLFYSVISLARDGRSRWYGAIGIAVTIGVLSKYNFAIVILATIASACTVESYRKRLLDWRIAISVVIAAIAVMPHAIWMFNHIDLVTTKTVTTLTTNQTHHWLTDVSAGSAAFASSTLNCCLFTFALFGWFWVRRKAVPAADLQQAPIAEDEFAGDTAKLIERFLLLVTIILCVMVLTGNALEFKNRWLQPFVVMFPAYLVLRFRNLIVVDRIGMNRVCVVSGMLMVVILVAVVTRPIVGGYRNRYSGLNVPYEQLAVAIERQYGGHPSVIATTDMRVAGNLRLHFPNTRFMTKEQNVFSGENRHDAILPPDSDNSIVFVTDCADINAQRQLMDYVRSQGIDLGVDLGVAPRGWQSIELRYRYSRSDATRPFHFRGDRFGQVAERHARDESQRR